MFGTFLPIPPAHIKQLLLAHALVLRHRTNKVLVVYIEIARIASLDPQIMRQAQIAGFEGLPFRRIFVAVEVEGAVLQAFVAFLSPNVELEWECQTKDVDTEVWQGNREDNKRWIEDLLFQPLYLCWLPRPPRCRLLVSS